LSGGRSKYTQPWKFQENLELRPKPIAGGWGWIAMAFRFPMSFDARSILMNKRNLVATTVVLGAFVGFAPASRAADDGPAADKPEQLFKTLDKNGDGRLTSDEVGEDRKRFFEHLIRVADGDKNGVLTAEEFQKGLKDEPAVQAGPQRGAGPGPGRPGGPGGEGRPRFGNPDEFFKRLDSNGDGKVTLDEVPEPAKRIVEGMLERSGKAKDAGLTKEDIAKLGQNFRPGAGPGAGPGGGQFGNPEEMFKRFDTNGDGKITLDEAPDRAREMVERMLERAGKGKDGSISKEEYLRAAAQFRPGGAAPGGAPEGRSPINPEENFKRMDANGDGKVTLDEIPERARPIVERMLEATGKGKDGSLTLDDFKKAAERFGQAANQPGARRPGDGERPREGDRPRESDRPRTEGDRPREDDRRPEGAPRDGQGPPRPQAAFFRKLDANGDGRISKAEVAKAAAVFDELDENKDGELDARELFGAPPTGAGDRRPDQPRDGERRPDERRPETDRRPDQPANRPADARPDATKSNRPATRPAEAARKADAKGGARGRQAFQEMDKNGDGKISKDEATGRLKEQFDRIDADKDGFISTEEMQRMARDLRKKDQ
jgi:Ca2+-binding EF-hand superfamily protein